MNRVLEILSLSLVISILFWIWRKDASVMRRFFWPAAIWKLVAGLLVGVVHYRYYMQSDTVYFFEKALQLNEVALQDFSVYLKWLVSAPDGNFLGVHRTLVFIKLLSIVTLITGGNYYIASIFFSLISFLAAWNLTLWISRLAPGMAAPAVFSLIFFPSCVFWSSGILKESVAMAGIYYLASVSIKIWLRHRLTVLNILLSISSVWIVWSLKYYYASVFISIAGAVLIVRLSTAKLPGLSFGREAVGFAGIVMVLLLAGGFFHPNLKPWKIPHIIYETRELLQAKSKQESIIQYHNLQPTWGSLFVHTPVALVSGLFAPVVPRSSNFFQGLAAIENLILLVFTVFSLPLLRQLHQSPYRLWVVAILLYVSLLAVFLALSTPNVGTLVRYRIGFLPFYVVLVAQHPYIRQWIERFFVYSR
ncbi:MAG: hypothetical protein ACK4RF_02085 [Cyclobacteriaceae bacterium]